MSLSPFDSFQSRFVTYLLNFPRTIMNNDWKGCGRKCSQPTLGRLEVQLYSVFRLRHQKGVRGQRHAPAAFYPQERPGTHCYRRHGRPQGRFGRRRISPLPSGFDPRTVQPIVTIPSELPSLMLGFSCLSNIDNQLDATVGFINISNQLNMFRATISPIFRNISLCLQLVI